VDSAGLSSFFVKKLNPPPAEVDDWLFSGGFEASDCPFLPPPPPNEKPPKGLLEPAAGVLFEAVGFAPNRPPPDAEPDVSFAGF